MAKKKKEAPEDKQFVSLICGILSSSTCRACNQAYFNIAPGIILLTNSTTSSKDEEGDRLIDYKVGTLSMHLIQIKDSVLYSKLLSLLFIPDMYYYCVDISKFTKIIKNHSLNNLESRFCTNGDIALVRKGIKTINDSDIVATPVKSYHLVRELNEYYNSVSCIGSIEHIQNTPHICEDMPIPEIVMGKVYYFDIPIKRFLDKQGKPIFSQCVDFVRVPGWDGLSSVSYKEFVKKLSAKYPYIWKLYAWTVSNAYILVMTIFENDIVSIRTIRPNILVVPPDKNITTIQQDILSQEEIVDGSGNDGSKS